MSKAEFTLDDMLRVSADANAKIVALQQQLAEAQKERDARLTDQQVEEFATKLFFAWAVWYHDQQTQGLMGQILQRLQGVAPFSVTAVLRDYRRFG